MKRHLIALVLIAGASPQGCNAPQQQPAIVAKPSPSPTGTATPHYPCLPDLPGLVRPKGTVALPGAKPNTVGIVKIGPVFLKKILF